MQDKFFLGTIGMTDREYYESTPYTLLCRAEGYFDKRDRQDQITRMHAYLIHLSLVAKPAKLEEFWQLESDGKENTKPLLTKEQAAEQWELIKKIHNIQ